MLNIQSISKTFNPGTVNAKQALSGLSLHLNHGDFVTIIGSNGAGKSTLFNAIAGSFYVDDGFIELDGEDITYMPEHKRSLMVGRLFQDPLKGTAPGMTIEENLALAYLRTAKGKSPFSRISKKDKDAFRERLSLLNMGLENRMTQPVGLLSGGQRQALTLLMATLITPKLLLLDEHTAALDPGTAEKVLELTKNIVAEEKITCLMITHNMNQALELGNRTLMMANGNIVLDVGGAERASMTVEDLIARFKTGAGHAIMTGFYCRNNFKKAKNSKSPILSDLNLHKDGTFLYFSYPISISQAHPKALQTAPASASRRARTGKVPATRLRLRSLPC